MKKKRKKPGRLLLSLGAAAFAAALPGLSLKAEAAGSIYESPYVSFSPDGAWWTVAEDLPEGTQGNFKDPACWYDSDTVVDTGIESALRGLETGEHYYAYDRNGIIPVGYWEVGYRGANCCHSNGGFETIGGITGINNSRLCLQPYWSGWLAYCADCGQRIVDRLHYMSLDAVRSINAIDVDISYFYLCPNENGDGTQCRHLEQGAPAYAHQCSAVSWNRYRVEYDPNTDSAGGMMEPSFHMYNNAEEYEGSRVTPQTRLSLNTYTRPGYEFVCWNTEPDGSGTSYGDGAEIRNLTSEEYDKGTGKGVVTLYAQWKKTTSTLLVDPAGGTYEGKSGTQAVTQGYNTFYTADPEKITAPGGHTVSFETNGGNEISPITGTQHFSHWEFSHDEAKPGAGVFYSDNRYLFRGPQDAVDRLQAAYEKDAIILPTPEKPGSSFGGWYKDPECTEPAGAGGDEYTPSQDETLYALWAELVLQSRDNYTANGGKGAVDLAWQQKDSADKSYRLYQSRDGVHFSQIYGAEETIDRNASDETFSYSGSMRQYTVPYTGFYTLSAYGAQGQGWQDIPGGLGGSAEGKFYLKKGDVLSILAGGTGGYGGGGTGSVYGTGGGRTSIVSRMQGTLLVAGGGGAATPMGAGGAGGAGGSQTSSASGGSGGAGGGGGYRGGSAGELVIHEHTDECYYVKDLSYTYSTAGMHTIAGWGLRGGRRFAGCTSPSWVTDENGMTESSLIPTKGNPTLEIDLHVNAWAYNAMQTYVYVTVYDSSRRQIYSWRADEHSTVTDGNPGESWEDGDGWHGTPDVFDIETVLSVDVSGTDGVWVAYGIGTTSKDDEGEPWAACHYGYNLNTISLSGGVEKELICGYKEGEVISAKPAYGGTSYVNTAAASTYQSRAGVRSGNGSASIAVNTVGFMDALSLNGVTATDYAAPDAVDADSVEIEAAGAGAVLVSFDRPKDNGTPYYHRAESYLTGTASLLCTSNITKNILTSGVAGYYYVLDTEEKTAAGAGNGRFTADESLTVQAGGQVQYLHVAAVDIAGNVGEAAHIPIDEGEVLWKLYTRQLSIEEADNVYPAGREKTWYVRADGSTPFTLRHSAYMDGTASRDYQINYTIFQTRTEGSIGRNIVFTPSHDIKDGTILTKAAELSYTVEGETLLGQYPYIVTERSSRNRELSATQKFTLDRAAQGQQIEVAPMAGAAHAQGIQYTEESADRLNGIVLIGDGEAPVVNGLELLENRELIDRREGTVTLDVTTADALSGVKEFYIVIENRDNAATQTYTGDENGRIQIEITADEPIFSGDFTVTARALDNVGNVAEKTCSVTEFALEAEVERILEPHTPVFKRGESGILTVTVWGYADRVEVEFPKELTDLNPDLNQTYVYADAPQYRQEEKLQFMIPLYAPEKESYTITVRAYKGDRRLEEHPRLGVVSVEGSVLQDFRTRLR